MKMMLNAKKQKIDLKNKKRKKGKKEKRKKSEAYFLFFFFPSDSQIIIAKMTMAIPAVIHIC